MQIAEDRYDMLCLMSSSGYATQILLMGTKTTSGRLTSNPWWQLECCGVLDCRCNLKSHKHFENGLEEELLEKYRNKTFFTILAFVNKE